MRLKSSIILLLIFTFNCLFSQQKTIDSLKNLLEKTQGIEKLEIENSLNFAYLSYSPQKAILSIPETYEKAKKLNDTDALIDAIINYADLLLLQFYNDSTIAFLKKHRNIFNKSKNKEKEIVYFDYLATAFAGKGELDSSLFYFNMALELATKEDIPKRIAAEYTNLATTLEAKGNIEQALEYYLESLKLFEDKNHKPGVAITLNNIGNLYNSLNEKENALKYFLLATKIGFVNLV